MAQSLNYSHVFLSPYCGHDVLISCNWLQRKRGEVVIPAIQTWIFFYIFKIHCTFIDFKIGSVLLLTFGGLKWNLMIDLLQSASHLSHYGVKGAACIVLAFLFATSCYWFKSICPVDKTTVQLITWLDHIVWKFWKLLKRGIISLLI